MIQHDFSDGSLGLIRRVAGEHCCDWVLIRWVMVLEQMQRREVKTSVMCVGHLSRYSRCNPYRVVMTAVRQQLQASIDRGLVCLMRDNRKIGFP